KPPAPAAPRHAAAPSSTRLEIAWTVDTSTARESVRQCLSAKIIGKSVSAASADQPASGFGQRIEGAQCNAGRRGRLHVGDGSLAEEGVRALARRRLQARCGGTRKPVVADPCLVVDVDDHERAVVAENLAHLLALQQLQHALVHEAQLCAG